MLEWKRRLRSFDECIDLSRIDTLRGIDVGLDRIEIGACATLDDLDRAGDSCHELEVLAAIARVMCTVQTRTLATIGGNLINASPAADLAPPLMSLGAVVRLASPRGEHELPVAELFLGPKRSVLTDDELLVRIVVPRNRQRAAAFDRIARTHVDIALALSACSIEIDVPGRVIGLRVALGSVAPTPLLVDVAGMAVGRRLDELDAEDFDLVGRAAAAASAPIDDVRTSGPYRREMCRVLTRRALGEAGSRLAGQLA